MTTAEREQQRVEALALANHVRLFNSEYKHDLAALPYAEGCLKIADLLDRPPTGPLATMKIGALLLSVRRLGSSKVADLLKSVGIYSADRRLGSLTARQRTALAAALRRRARA